MSVDELNGKICKDVRYGLTLFGPSIPNDDLNDALYIFQAMVSRWGEEMQAGSEQIRFYYDGLSKIVADIQRKKPDEADYANKLFAPSIAYFKQRLDNRQRAVINCSGNSPASVERARTLPPKDHSKIDLPQLEKFVRERFGIETSGNLEEALAHKVFYADIKPWSGDLVLVLADVHTDIRITADYIKLLARLASEKGFELVLGLEKGPKKSEENGGVANGSKGNPLIAILKTAIEQGMKAEDVFLNVMSNKDYEAALCNDPKMVMISRESLYTTGDKCSIEQFVPITKEIFEDTLCDGRAAVWPLENASQRAEAEALISDLKNGSKGSDAKVSEAVRHFVQSFQTLSIERSKTMADTLVDDLASNRTMRHRIVVFSVGGEHVFEVVKELKEKNINGSVVGLMSMGNFYRKY